MVCSYAKEREREWGAESNGKLPHLFTTSKTATLVPEFTVEDLSLGRTAALVPEFAVKDLFKMPTFQLTEFQKMKLKHKLQFQWRIFR